VHVSQDGGQRWENRNKGIDYQGAINWSSHHGSIWLPDNRILMGGGRAVYTTQDQGRTWEKVLETPNITSAFGYAFHKSEVVYAGTGRGYNRHRVTTPRDPDENPERLTANASGGGIVYRSDDGGRAGTWRRVNKDGDNGIPRLAHVVDLAVDPGDPNHVYATTDFDLYVSKDGGATWRSIQGFFGRTNVNQVETMPGQAGVALVTVDYVKRGVEPAVERGVYRTDDGGESWTALNNGLSAEHKGFWAIAYDPLNLDALYLGCKDWNGALYRSLDGGRNWGVLLDKTMTAKLKDGQWGWGRSPHIAVAATIRVGGGDADGDGLSDFVYFLGDNNGQIFRSIDGGRMFEQIYTRPRIIDGQIYWTARGEMEFDCVRETHVNPANPNHIIMLCYDWPPFESIDGGESWRLAMPQWNERELVASIGAFVFDLDDPSTSYVGHGRGSRGRRGSVYRRKAGSKFRRIGGGPDERAGFPNAPVRAMRLVRWIEDGKQQKYLYAGAGGVAMYRLDVAVGLKRWEEVSKGFDTPQSLGFLCLAPVPDSSRIYLGTGDGVFVTDDGKSWRRLTGEGTGAPKVTTVRSMTLKPGNHNTIYAAVMRTWTTDPDDGVYRSKDAGETWEQIAFVDMPHDLTYYPVPDEPTLLVGSKSMGVVQLTEDPATGKWEKSTFAHKHNGLDHTRVWGVDLDPNHPERVYVGTHGTGLYKNWTFVE